MKILFGDMDVSSFNKRFITFTEKWPQTFSAHQMASAGFHYLDFRDVVQCSVCKVILGNWNPRDNPLKRHFRANSKCPFLLHGLEEQVSFQVTVMAPHMNTFTKRKSTFRGCSEFRICTDLLARNGFFYTGSHHQVQCYLCGICIRTCDVIPSHHPDCPIPQILTSQSFSDTYTLCYPKMKEWRKRRRTFKRDPFGKKLARWGFFKSKVVGDVRCFMCGESLKSEKKLLKSHASTCLIPKILTQEPKEIEIDEEKLCVICIQNEKNVVSVDCGHVACCENCIERLERCPMCRETITETLRVYY